MFAQAEALAPTAAAPMRERARAYLASNRNLNQALALAEKALELAPTAQHYHLASWARDRNGNLDGAIAFMEKAAQMEPENPEYRRLLNLLIVRRQE